MESRYEICIECQACCRKFGIEIPGDPLLAEFLQEWGFAIYPADDDKGFYAVLEHPCKHITEKGCSIYSRRPEYCRAYEGINDPVLKRFCKLEPLRKENKNASRGTHSL